MLTAEAICYSSFLVWRRFPNTQTRSSSVDCGMFFDLLISGCWIVFDCDWQGKLGSVDIVPKIQARAPQAC